MSELREMKCVPCSEGVPRLGEAEVRQLLAGLDGWEVVRNHHLKKRLTFPDFSAALEFINRVGEVAEREGHHPDVCFGWGYADVTIYTHKIDGLSESDFILASKVDAL